MKFLARLIVLFLKKHKLNIHDWKHSGRDKWMWLYNMFYAEYKDKVKNYPDLEVSHISNNFQYVIQLEYSYKNIKFDINDLTWFLTRNRYLINKKCKNAWCYYNLKYYFANEQDYKTMLKVFNKSNKIL